MKFKLDENFAGRTVRLFRERKLDVETVRDEELEGATDQTLFEACVQERRCLVTLDLNFSNVIRFPPKETTGIAVIRVPSSAE